MVPPVDVVGWGVSVALVPRGAFVVCFRLSTDYIINLAMRKHKRSTRQANLSVADAIEWPEARERRSRGAKVTPVTPTKQAQADEAMQEATQGTTALAIIRPDPLAAIIEAEAEAIEEPTAMEIAFEVTG